MKLEDLTTIEQPMEFLSDTQAVAFSVISNNDDGYRWMKREWVKFRYLTLSRRGKGIFLLCLDTTTVGYQDLRPNRYSAVATTRLRNKNSAL